MIDSLYSEAGFRTGVTAWGQKYMAKKVFARLHDQGRAKQMSPGCFQLICDGKNFKPIDKRFTSQKTASLC